MFEFPSRSDVGYPATRMERSRVCLNGMNILLLMMLIGSVISPAKPCLATVFWDVIPDDHLSRRAVRSIQVWILPFVYRLLGCLVWIDSVFGSDQTPPSRPMVRISDIEKESDRALSFLRFCPS